MSHTFLSNPDCAQKIEVEDADIDNASYLPSLDFFV